MKSFRSELEDINNPVVAKDIIDLEKKIRLFREGKIDDDKFRSLRLLRGIYGQRQPGVQMVRIKLPFGRISTKQIRRIADISDEYASSNLHATTRQDIQIHFVSLDRTPELWSKLEEDSITIREACGNTVRNITASPTAGIDPNEPFDVSPYAHEAFTYLLRNPVNQEMGRKFKISFSATDEDTAYAFIHDLGFIPKIVDGKRGFRVLIGGGLGAIPYLALLAYEFLEEDQMIPFIESVLRVYDRYGERNRRMKARMKFLIDDIGLEEMMRLVDEERNALPYKNFPIDRDILAPPNLSTFVPGETITVPNEKKYQQWLDTNVMKQKQEGYFGVFVKLPLGNLSSEMSRKFADVVDQYASDELRITVNQGYLIRFVREDVLKHLYLALDQLTLAEPGFDSVGDITACPGTDSCNLGISDSTQISLELERVIREEYPDLIHNHDIKIKLSGCPNSCGQHGLASIGFHGSTIKDKQGKVVPALVVMLGGAKLTNGDGIISDKILKIPSRKGPDAIRMLLDDYESQGLEGEYYHDYFKRIGRGYFYTLLKPLADLTTLTPIDYMDWGQDHNFVLHTAVGECAGVIIDLVSTLLYDSEEKLAWASQALDERLFADSIYHSYSAFINTAKAMLLTVDIKPSTQIQTLNDFQKHFVEAGLISCEGNFKDFVLRMSKQEPTSTFALGYMKDSKKFLADIVAYKNVEKQIA
ncbi:MAG: nitrite reductase [Cyclobacteriaceae bacterium]